MVQFNKQLLKGKSIELTEYTLYSVHTITIRWLSTLPSHSIYKLHLNIVFKTPSALSLFVLYWKNWKSH